MREYGKVSPQFWIGKTGKALRGKPDEQLLALYLMTSPHANMIGLFHCPVAYMAHETGLTIEGASKALQSLVDVGFCTFDAENEYVFVHQFAAHQIGKEMSATDKRCKGVENELAKVRKGLCYQAFIDRYSAAYHLQEKPKTKPKVKGLRSPIQAPSKPGAGAGAETGAEDGSAEPHSDSAPATPSGILIPLVDGTDYDVPLESIAEWKQAYPAVDVAQQLREMRVWCLNNPLNRKTRRGVGAFATRWLGKEQDKASRVGNAVPTDDWRSRPIFAGAI